MRAALWSLCGLTPSIISQERMPEVCDSSYQPERVHLVASLGGSLICGNSKDDLSEPKVPLFGLPDVLPWTRRVNPRGAEFLLER